MLAFTAGFGGLLVLKQRKPFWVDEWRIIYNLKFRTVPRLWEGLDYMQQAPRVYLSILKVFLAAFDYSYSALRLPPFVVGTALMLAAWRLMRRIYPDASPLRYLFVLLPLCSLTFSGYYVQIKQYTMDMLLSLAAIWQLLELLRMEEKEVSRRRVLLLCAAGCVLPFFSYTYPIAIAPAYGITLARMFKGSRGMRNSRVLLPVAAGLAGICVFYVIDVRQLMADGGMKMFWGHLMLREGYSWQGVSVAPDLFTKILQPSLFNTVLGYCCLAAFLLRAGTFLLSRKRAYDMRAVVECYSVLLLTFMLMLFFAGKLPIGEARLNAFGIPAMSMLLIWFLRQAYSHYAKWPASFAALLLLAGVIAAGVQAQFAPFREDMYARKLGIYRATESALKEASAKGLPVLITPEVAYPWHESRNFPFYDPIPGDWVLKTLPGYHVRQGLPVINIANMEAADSVFALMPARQAMAGDGLRYRILNK